MGSSSVGWRLQLNCVTCLGRVSQAIFEIFILIVLTDSTIKALCEVIWSNFMRTHICLNICHFLQSVVSITEGPKNKIMRKSGIHSSVPCWDSTWEQFLFYRVSGKNKKSHIFWSHSYKTIILSKQHFCHKREALRNIVFFNFFGHPAK